MSNQQLEVYDKCNDMDSIQQLGKAIALSGMFGCEKPEQGIILALQCMTERKPPLELAKTYHIIKGKLSKKADAMLAEFRKAGGKWRWHDLKNREVQAASIEWEGQKLEVSYSIDDAKQAGWWTEKDRGGNPTNWIKIPANMCRARLVSETLRAIAPEIVQGSYTPEEIENFDEPKSAPIKRADTIQKVADMSRAEPVKAIPTPAVEVTAEVTTEEDDQLDGDHPRDRLEPFLSHYEEQVNAWLIGKDKITDGQTWRECPAKYLIQIESQKSKFLKAVGVEIISMD